MAAPLIWCPLAGHSPGHFSSCPEGCSGSSQWFLLPIQGWRSLLLKGWILPEQEQLSTSQLPSIKER